MKRTALVLTLASLAACQALPPGAAGGGDGTPRAVRVPGSAAPNEKPAAASARATVTPGAAAIATPGSTTTATPGAGATAKPAGLPPATVAAGKAPQLPTKVTPPLPAPLRGVMGSLIGQDGSSLVAAGGLNMIGQDGSSYVVLQASAFSLAQVLRDQLALFMVTAMITEGLLKAAMFTALQPGAMLTVVDEDNTELTPAEKQLPENKLTLTLALFPDHATLKVYRGSAVDPSRQVAAVAFEGPTRGRAVLRDLAPKADGTQNWLAHRFDLDAGTCDANMYAEGPGPKRAHVAISYQAIPGAAAGEPTFKVRTAAYGKDPAKDEDGVFELSANFRDEGAAAIVGVLPTKLGVLTGGKLIFMPEAGEPDPTTAKPHVHFLDGAGKDLASGGASALLKGLAPPDDDVKRPFLTDPTQPKERAPLDLPEFQFPE